MASENKSWATEYVLDPLTAPQPSEETGPGTNFRREDSTTSSASRPLWSSAALRPSTPESNVADHNKLSKNNPYRKSLEANTPERKSSIAAVTEVRRSSSLRSNGAYPSPPASASPRSNHNSPSYRQQAFGVDADFKSRPRRSSSLTAKYPGDMSHRPLDQLTKEKGIADRSRHATKKHHIQPDTIDKLDDAVETGAYHHSGPYDATLYARNNSYEKSPLQALATSNAEALKATPHEKIMDSIQRHRPLDGVAAFAPGEQDRNGHMYEYRQGENMMIDVSPEGGAYKRWPGIQYHPDDVKGKGEPSYSIEKALKDHKLGNGEEKFGDTNGIEMKTHNSNGSRPGSRPGSSGVIAGGGWDDGEAKSKRFSGEVLKKRIGSLKKHLHHD